jgi:hypothetical protein
VSVRLDLCLAYLFLIKAETGELAMEFSSRSIICAGGFCFVFEVAEVARAT